LVRLNGMKPRALLFLLAACHHDAKPAPDALAPTATASASAAPSASATASPVPTPSAPLAIVDLGGGRFAIENDGADAARVKSAAAIERKTDTGWQALYIDVRDGYRLVEQCPARGTPVDACVSVPAHGELDPARWTGFNCSGQCNMICRANAFEGPGTFRLVVSTCDGARVEGPAFEMPSFRDPPALDRWALATNIASASVVRLDNASAAHADTSAPASPGHVAGFATKGAEHPLDSSVALGALRAFLQDGRGFDDKIMKRCAMGPMVGVRLERDLPSTAAARRQTVEIAMDFSCNKLFAAFGEGSHRVTLASHFDPSHRAAVTWAKAVFPGDAEIAKLR